MLLRSTMLFTRAGAAPGATFADAMQRARVARSGSRPRDGRCRTRALWSAVHGASVRPRAILLALLDAYVQRSGARRMSTPQAVRDALAHTIVGQARGRRCARDGAPRRRASSCSKGCRASRRRWRAARLPLPSAAISSACNSRPICYRAISSARASSISAPVTFVTMRGPLFANIVLADEINRAPAKVQSALLEGMQERSATIGLETFRVSAAVLGAGHDEPLRCRRHLCVAARAARSFSAERQSRVSGPRR